MDIDDHSEDIFEGVTNPESTFYQQGYDEGYAHGRLHGLFEGRELGREKGWEILEEVGFYDGWAKARVKLLQRGSTKGREGRALNHAKILLDLISKFPMTNPSETALIDTTSANDSELDSADVESPQGDQRDSGVNEKQQVDMSALLASIRARYRLLCSSLSVRPRLGVAQMGNSQEGTAAEGIVQGIEGPMKGMNTKQLLY